MKNNQTETVDSLNEQAYIDSNESYENNELNIHNSEQTNISKGVTEQVPLDSSCNSVKNSWLDQHTDANHARKVFEDENKLGSAVFDFEASVMPFKGGKALIAALLGNLIERYDYALYGYMAATLSQKFFPSEDPAVSLIKYFLMFSMGFLAKPIGAYIFGCIGDGYGRKIALRWSILGIAVPTGIIGLLPVYSSAGKLSVVLLGLCRLAQGIFISAEADGVEIFIYESIRKTRACTYASLTCISEGLGISLASFMTGIIILPMCPDGFWRVPFLIGGILGIFTAWFRKYLVESYDYMLQSIHQEMPASKSFTDYFKVLNKNKLNALLALLIKGSEGGVYYFIFIFWNTYLSKILNIISPAKASFQAMILVIISTLIAPLCGYITDRLGILRTLKISIVLCLMMLGITGAVLYYFQSAPLSLMILSTIIFMFLSAPANILLIKLFDISERYRCTSISHALGSMLISSTAPAAATLMWTHFHIQIAPLFYCAFLLTVIFVTTYFVKIKTEICVFDSSTESEDVHQMYNLKASTYIQDPRMSLKS